MITLVWIAAGIMSLSLIRSNWAVFSRDGEPAVLEYRLDLGFTPATNLQQLRRVRLEIGESTDVAWQCQYSLQRVPGPDDMTR